MVDDNFDSAVGFEPMEVSGDPSAVRSRVENSIVHISVDPRDFYTSATVKKLYDCNLSTPIWFEFRVRMNGYLLGLDSYTTLTFFSLNVSRNIDKKLGFLTVGINSEAHWKRVYFDGKGEPPCTEKLTDDEFFISTDLFDAPDTRLRYPVGHTNPYTNWTVFAIRYVPPANDHLRGRITLFVDGHEVTDLTILDNPSQSVDTQTDALASVEACKVELALCALSDGFEHGHPGNKYGRRGTGCYARACPAIPSPTAYPAKFDGNDGSALKATWMNNFDAVADAVIECMRNYQLPDGTRPFAPGLSQYSKTSGPPSGARSAIDNMHTVEPANPLGYYGLYSLCRNYITQRSGQSEALYQYMHERIWHGIWEGTLEFRTCVLMGAIGFPAPSHVIWRFNPPGTLDELTTILRRCETTYPDSMAQSERFVWDTCYSYGGFVDAAHLGYLEPGAVRASSAWAFMSAEEQASVIPASQPSTGTLEWDYFRSRWE